MPDGDVISRGIRFAWRSAYEGVQGLNDPVVVGRRVAKAVSRTLRVTEGVEGFHSAADVLSRARSGALSRKDALVEIRAIGISKAPLRDVVVRATTQCVLRPPGDVDPTRDLAVAIITGMMNGELFAKAVPALIEDGIATAADASRYVDECRDAVTPDLLRIAEQLASQPIGTHFRAPPHRVPRKPTEDMLGDSIL